MTLAPFYRLYDLPWSPTEEVERRFRKVVRNAFIIFAIFAILIPLLPVREHAAKAPEIPDRIVKLVLEKKVPPPPPPPKIEEKKPEPEKKVEAPKPPPPKPDARERAQNAGLLKLQDQLADLRDKSGLCQAARTKHPSGSAGRT